MNNIVLIYKIRGKERVKKRITLSQAQSLVKRCNLKSYALTTVIDSKGEYNVF